MFSCPEIQKTIRTGLDLGATIKQPVMTKIHAPKYLGHQKI